jgi:hypothetical protein
MSRQFVDLSGKQFGKWSVLQRSENSKHGFIFWICKCVCGLVKDVKGASLTDGKSTQCRNCSLQGNNYNSKGRPRGNHSEAEIAALRQRNFERRGKPLTSERALSAVRSACKKMNEVRHLQARHILSNVDAGALVADCSVCGKVPIKVCHHRHEKWNIRDQYSCWVGTRSRTADGIPAQVSYPNQALEMWNAQESNCALCHGPMVREGNSQDGATLDHCHVTGKLRGFLHQGCNKGLGHFNDDLQKLQQAVVYLEHSAFIG